jgi:hypothetical protein
MNQTASSQRQTAKIFTVLGAISLGAGLLVGSPIAIICGIPALTVGAWTLTTSGHSIRWNRTHHHHGIWTATCRNCAGTHTRGPLRIVLRAARSHQFNNH